MIKKINIYKHSNINIIINIIFKSFLGLIIFWGQNIISSMGPTLHELPQDLLNIITAFSINYNGKDSEEIFVGLDKSRLTSKKDRSQVDNVVNNFLTRKNLSEIELDKIRGYDQTKKYNFFKTLFMDRLYNDQDTEINQEIKKLGLPNTFEDKIKIALKNNFNLWFNRQDKDELGSLLRTNYFQKNYKFIKELLDHGIDPNLYIKNDRIHALQGKTLLHIAAQDASIDAIALLLKYKANPNAFIIKYSPAFYNYITPLHEALIGLSWSFIDPKTTPGKLWRYKKAIEMLLKNGADPKIKYNYSRTYQTRNDEPWYNNKNSMEMAQFILKAHQGALDYFNVSKDPKLKELKEIIELLKKYK